MLKTTRIASFFVRNIHTNLALNVRRRRQNPGIELRAGLLRQGERTDLHDFQEDPEFDPDSDFLNVHKSHRQHEREMLELKEKISLWRVRDKYFKVKLPNLMTWAEKEHIRYLHDTEPEEWTPRALSEGFPIDEAHIRKLLKAKWQPKNAEKMKKHDEKVRENWKKLEQGEFNLPPELHEHLMKFKERSAKVSASKFESRRPLIENIKTKNTEFLDIITSSSRKKVEKEPKIIVEERNSQKEFLTSRLEIVDSTKAEGEKVGHQRMTLSELKRLLGDDDSKEDASAEVFHEGSTPETKVISKKSGELESLDPNLLKEISMPEVRDHIRIPRRLWRKGKIYKFHDCYYDDDGELLYRVPGMTK